jgi:DnaJ-domain-containing protein 1
VDHFAVLGIPRAAWVDAENLKSRFHKLSAERHPDAAGGHGTAFTELNAAWQALREPAGCLRHFLELEHPSALGAAGKTPPELGDLFMRIAAFRQAAQKFGLKLEAATSPLTKAVLEGERLVFRSRLSDLATEVEARTVECMTTLRSEGAEPAQLATQLASLVFLAKWTAQLAELRVGL